MTQPTGTTSNLTVILLLVVAILLGYAIYRDRSVGLSTMLPRWRAPASSPPADRGAENDIDQIRRVPDQRASEEVKLAYHELVSRLAEAASVLDITGCTAKPLALKVAEGSTVTVRNADAVAHTMNLGQRKFTVPAKGAVMLTAAFDTGPGIYGYGCDTGLSIVGVLYITPR